MKKLRSVRTIIAASSNDIHEQTLASADLLHLRIRRPFSLSIGQQQRTALASCIALRPALVILDEPTLGQDWRHLQQLMDCLVRLNHKGQPSCSSRMITNWSIVMHAVLF